MADRWRDALSWAAALLMAAVFLTAGLWKLTDPAGASVRLAQARVPEYLSVAATAGLGIAETFAGLLLLVPRFRRWGASLGGILLLAFMVFIGIHYAELRGADCSCFPWVKRAVGPGFFAADSVMLLMAVAAGVFGTRARGWRPAAAILALVMLFAATSYAIRSARHQGKKAPESIAAEDGHRISLQAGKVVVFFFNPHCLHCLEAGRRLATLHWGSTRLIGVPTESPRFAEWFMAKAGLSGKGAISGDLEPLKKTFPFDEPPAAVALEDGRERGMILQFEDKEPRATLEKLGFAN